MKNPVLFIHGGGEGAHEADRPLAESLQGALGAEYDVRYPAMPNEQSPTYAEWRNAIARELAAFDRKAALVGHSFGASLLLKYVAEEPLHGRASGLFLIAAPFWRAEDWDVPEFALADDFAARLPAELRLFFYHSRDDETVPFTHLARYRELLPSATFRELDARGHQFEGNLVEVAADVLLVR
ncbi:alpha/beta fold hydrolase [Sorangium sp. So ce1078]|uniref:alpha/beta fold hydrolase n=1 Tax=Sorangium sp. So ce1078 TaxID=3133329 RepID=UPI003F5FDB8F